MGFKNARQVAVVSNPRGLTFGTDGLLYVASEKVGVVVFNVTTMQQVNVFGDIHPIDLVTYKDLIIYGVKGSKSAIHAWSTSKGSEQFMLTSDDLDHPAGMAIDGDTLYVLSQTTKQLLKWNLVTQQYLGVAIPNVKKFFFFSMFCATNSKKKKCKQLPDLPECIALVNC